MEQVSEMFNLLTLFRLIADVIAVTEKFSGKECKSKHEFCKLFNKRSGELRYVDGRHVGLTVDEAYEIEEVASGTGLSNAAGQMATGILEPIHLPVRAHGSIDMKGVQTQDRFSDNVALQEQLRDLGLMVPASTLSAHPPAVHQM